MVPGPMDWYKADGLTPYSYEELPSTRALTGESVPETEIFVRNEQCPAGIWISVQANPLRNKAGEIHGSVVTFRDVTTEEAGGRSNPHVDECRRTDGRRHHHHGQ